MSRQGRYKGVAHSLHSLPSSSAQEGNRVERGQLLVVRMENTEAIVSKQGHPEQRKQVLGLKVCATPPGLIVFIERYIFSPPLRKVIS